MSGYLLDTNVPSELSRSEPNTNVEAWLASANRTETYISVVTLGEIRKGFTIVRDATHRRRLEEWFARDIDLWFEERILPITRAIAERWGVIDGERQLRGRPLNTADGLIAATALEHELSLVTRNVRDYEGLDLTMVNPWES